jgi:hypothetical protein
MLNAAKQERNIQRNVIAAMSGRIKWTARGIQDGLRHVETGWLASISEEKNDRSLEPCIAAYDYARTRYSGVTGSAHAVRLTIVINFLQRHWKGLVKAGIIKSNGQTFELWDGALFQAFAKLPYEPPAGFGFEQIVDFVRRSKKPS